MTERGSRPVRRLRSVRPPVTDETAASILPGHPRVGALDALLREVDGLRLTHETDLTLAAAAVEAGAPESAVDIIDSDRDSLHTFESRALGHLSDLAAGPVVRRHSRWSRVPAAPFVAANMRASSLILSAGTQVISSAHSGVNGSMCGTSLSYPDVNLSTKSWSTRSSLMITCIIAIAIAPSVPGRIFRYISAWSANGGSTLLASGSARRSMPGSWATQF